MHLKDYPEILVLKILSYLKNRWIYDKKKCSRMLGNGKRLKTLNCTISFYLLYTPLHVYRGFLIHVNTNRKHIVQMLDELETYTLGYTVHHRLVHKCFRKMIYYMKRLGRIDHSEDLKIIQKQNKLLKCFLHYGYKEF